MPLHPHKRLAPLPPFVPGCQKLPRQISIEFAQKKADRVQDRIVVSTMKTLCGPWSSAIEIATGNLRLSGFCSAENLVECLPAELVMKDDSGATCTALPHRAVASGSEFEICVWLAMLDIPFGQRISYAGIARKLGRSATASRAVGNAIGRNPFAGIIPCHRVVCSNGQLGGYKWGSPVKQSLLDYEAQRRAHSRDLSALSAASGWEFVSS